MKNKTFKWFCVVTLTGALPWATIAASPSDDAQTKSFKKALTSVPAPEMAAKAASLIDQTKTADKKAAAIAAVRATLELSPSSIIAIVGSIARTAPETAPDIAATAAAALPKSAAAIAKAAAAAAPAYADKVVFAVCRVVPKEYASVAVAVSQAVPGASKKILSAVADAIPSLKIFIDRASADLAVMSKERVNGVTVAAVVDATNTLLDKAASSLHVNKDEILTQQLTTQQLARLSQVLPPPQGPPIFGPPFQTTPAANTEILVTVPKSGPRNYSSP